MKKGKTMAKNKTKNDKISVICDLDLNKYLGKWYEIGRLSASAQQGFDNVTATYSLKRNGKIKVYNAGYKKDKKRSITGSAWLKDEKCKGALYVRFFWPFKGDYNVIKLASDYRYAIVMGDSKSSLWILSRTQKMNTHDYQEVIEFLDIHGFNIQKILITKQNRDV
jgi:apolipoprotein D and lipocalin family protein